MTSIDKAAVLLLLDEPKRLAWTVGVYDTFTDPDGTLLESHTPDIDQSGAGWKVISGVASGFVINNNELFDNLSTGGTIGSQAFIDASLSDGVITGKIKLWDNNQFLHFRADRSTGYSLAIHFDTVLDGFKFIRYDGAYNSLASVSQVYNNGDWIDFEITLNGSSVTLKDLTNSIQISGTSTFQQTLTQVGVGEQLGNNRTRLDNIKMDKL